MAEYEGSSLQTQITTPAVNTVNYVRGPDMGGGVGGLLYSTRTETGGGKKVRYNLSNGRGDIVAQSDESATLTWTASYEAYGKRPTETGTNQDKQRANSKDEDPTGLLNEGFRYRDIETGVWLSRDPAGFVDGPNLYAYVKQNPWTAWDPHGLSLRSKVIKYAKNGGDWAATFADCADNLAVLSTTTSPVDAFCATWSLCSELLPVSAGEVKQGWKWGKKLLGIGDDVKDANKAGGQSMKQLKEQSDKLAKELEDRKQAALNPSPSIDPKRRGIDNEKKVLDDRGDVKNTESFETSHGTTIPDINNPKQIGDIKDVKVQADTKQMKAQREVALAEGKEHVVVTGDKTKVTTPLLNSGSKIERRKDIGPQ